MEEILCRHIRALGTYLELDYRTWVLITYLSFRTSLLADSDFMIMIVLRDLVVCDTNHLKIYRFSNHLMLVNTMFN